MSTSVDAVVVGGGTNGLVASIALAKAGRKVLLVESQSELGGTFREIEFAPGFRASPLAMDAGYLSPDVLCAIGGAPLASVATEARVVALNDSRDERVLSLTRSIASTAEGLKGFSAKDAQRWPEFVRLIELLSGFLGEIYRVPPMQIDMNSWGDFGALAKVGLKFRGLGKKNMVELMRTLPMAAADLLDDWFECEQLKGLLAAFAVRDVCQGPISGGTAFTLLHSQVGAQAGVFGERLRLKGGAGALISALGERARAAGVTTQTGVAVQQLIVREDRIAGVTLSSGEEVRCGTVLSSLDPQRTLLELLDPVHLEVEFISALRNIRFRGVTSKILLAMDDLPAIPGMTGKSESTVVIAPSIRYVERAYDAVKYGRYSEEPFVEVRFPSLTESGLAPAGKHVAVVHVQFTPYQLREESWDITGDTMANRALACVERCVPGFTSRIHSRTVLTPVDLEQQFGVREGACSQGEMMLDQILFMRPAPGASQYAMPLRGLFLCGTSVHPGGGITGMSGLLAARAALRAT